MTTSLPLLPTAEEPRYSTLIGRPLDNTALSAYQRCPRLYLYSMVLHRRIDGVKSPPLAYGTSWHHILAEHYKYNPYKVPGHPPLDARDFWIERLIELAEDTMVYKWTEHGVPDDHRTGRRIILDYKKYLKTYGLPWEEESQTIGWPENPMVELSGEVYVPGCRHPYAFKIDRLYKKAGQVFVEDHKHSSRTINFNEYHVSNQMMGYAVAGQLLTGQPIAGVRINGMVVHKGETLFHDPKTQKSLRQVIPFGQERLADWAKDLDQWFDRIETEMSLLQEPNPLRKVEPFPRNFNACAARYGLCGYAGICSLSPEIRQQALETDFEVVPWNPLEADGEEEVVE